VLYELCSLKRAFDGQSLPALIMKILRGKYPPVPFQYSPELQQLIADCLNRCALVAPARRIACASKRALVCLKPENSAGDSQQPEPAA